MGKLRLSVLAILLALGIGAGNVIAADSTVILDRERERMRAAPLSQPKPTVAEEEAQSTPKSDDMMLTLRSLSVSGSTVFSEGELLAPYKHLYGKQISYGRLRAISAEMTKKYREAGYILSRVIMPSQDADINNADIRLIAVEGYVESIEYSGDSRVLNRFKSYFSSIESDILSKKPLKHSAFERHMLLMKDVSGIDISSRFEKGTVSGGSKLHISVDGDLIDGSLSVGNTGTDETGPILGSVSVGVNTLPLVGNRMTATYTQATDQREYYSMQIANRYQFWNGLALNASYTYSASPQMDSDYADTYDFSTNSTTWNLGLSYPIIRSRDMNLFAAINYEQRNSDGYVEYPAHKHLQRDRLRTLSASLNFDFSDKFGGVTQIIPSVYRGLNILYATDESKTASNKDAPAEFWKFDLYVSRDQKLPNNFSLFTSAELQFSNSSLSSYNRFSYGGSQFGRGYEPGLLEGDNAFAVSLEPRYTMYPTENTSLQFFSFIDYGTIWTSKERGGEPDKEYGSSAGLGVRYWGHIGNSKLPDFKVSAFVAQPLRPVLDNNADSPRLVLQGAIFF